MIPRFPLEGHAYSPGVLRFRRACFTTMAIILVPLVVATAWAVLTTENWRAW